MSVLGMEMRVMALEDVLVTKLMALSEHSLRYESLLAIARALREQVDWEDVRSRTHESTWARAFFVMLEGLGDRARGETDDRRSRDARACADASRFGRRTRGVGAQHMAEPITQARLRALSAVHPDQGRVLSVFLNLDPTAVRHARARSSAITSVMTAAAHKVERERRALARRAHGVARRRRARPRRAAGLGHRRQRHPRRRRLRVRPRGPARGRPAPPARREQGRARPHRVRRAARDAGHRRALDGAARPTAAPRGCSSARATRSRRPTGSSTTSTSSTSKGGWSQSNYQRSVDKEVSDHLAERRRPRVRRSTSSAAPDRVLVGVPDELLDGVQGQAAPVPERADRRARSPSTSRTRRWTTCARRRGRRSRRTSCAASARRWTGSRRASAPAGAARRASPRCSTRSTRRAWRRC